MQPRKSQIARARERTHDLQRRSREKDDMSSSEKHGSQSYFPFRQSERRLPSPLLCIDSHVGSTPGHPPGPAEAAGLLQRPLLNPRCSLRPRHHRDLSTFVLMSRMSRHLVQVVYCVWPLPPQTNQDVVPGTALIPIYAPIPPRQPLREARSTIPCPYRAREVISRHSFRGQASEDRYKIGRNLQLFLFLQPKNIEHGKSKNE